jgi:hypothetical protein
MLQTARNPGRQHDRRDDLDALVQAILRMPGYYGIRQQQMSLLRAGKEAWLRTHRDTDTYTWPERVGYLDKSFDCYHRPEPLRLDVLVRHLMLKSGTDGRSDSVVGADAPAISA